MINPYESMVRTMRDQKKTGSGSGIQLATMTGSNTACIGDLPLYAADLYIPDRLLSRTCTGVAGTCPESGPLVDTPSYSSPLKAGDQVLVYQLSETEFAILERVVKAG